MTLHTNYRNNVETQKCPICGKDRARDWFGFGQTVCKRCWDLHTAEAHAHTERIKKLMEADKPETDEACCA